MEGRILAFPIGVAVNTGLELQFSQLKFELPVQPVIIIQNCDVYATGPTIPSTIPSQCCAVPFTLNGDVYYGCTDDGGGIGCFYGNREWKLCQQPAGMPKFSR